MRVGVMQAASQKGKNPFLEKGVRGAVPEDWEVVNFGVFPEEESDISYVEVALCAGLLLESGAVDFIVTGCSHSGVCNIAEYAKQVTGTRRVAGILGGFHLMNRDERSRRTMDYLAGEAIGELWPCHCTSFKVRAEMCRRMELGEVGVGLTREWR